MNDKCLNRMLLINARFDVVIRRKLRNERRAAARERLIDGASAAMRSALNQTYGPDPS